MKIQCDVCEKAVATVVCCADEAALCADCDVQVHAANKLASKHPRLLLSSLPTKHPLCDICQEKPAFIFCVEDRALFCRECDENIHVAGSLSGKHQRFLATGISVALSSTCSKKEAVNAKCSTEPSSSNSIQIPPKAQTPPEDPLVHEVPSAFFPPSPWSVEEFLQLSDYESTDKKGHPSGFGELDWLPDMGILSGDEIPSMDRLAPAEVPEMHNKTQVNSAPFYRPPKSSTVSKRPRVDSLDDFFAVPDLG